MGWPALWPREDMARLEGGHHRGPAGPEVLAARLESKLDSAASLWQRSAGQAADVSPWVWSWASETLALVFILIVSALLG